MVSVSPTLICISNLVSVPVTAVLPAAHVSLPIIVVSDSAKPDFVFLTNVLPEACAEMVAP